MLSVSILAGSSVLSAAELDPEFASAFGMAVWCYVLRKNYG
jgi:hypothetical protein